MGRFESDTSAIGDTTERSDRWTSKSTKNPHASNQLRKTILGKLLKWTGNATPACPMYFEVGDNLPTSGRPEEVTKSPRNKGGGIRKSPKREETKRRKSAYVVPIPRTPDPKSSLSSHEPADQEIQNGPMKDLLHRANTPSSVVRDSDTTESFMRDNCDRYRMMYLIVRLEQQQDHIRDVITSIRSHGNKRCMRNMIKIKEALSKLYGTMLSLRDEDPGAYQRIGTTLKDLVDFFNMVENVCSAVEDIPVEVGEPDGRHIPHGQRQVKNTTEGVRSGHHSGGLEPESVSHGKKLYVNERMGSRNCILFGDDSDSDGDLPCNIKTVWPTLNTNDKGRQKKDIELQCLMKEIDTLMDDVGLNGGENQAITYEELMAGVDMGRGCKKDGRNNKMQHQERKKKEAEAESVNTDEVDTFIEELDHLLDEAQP